ncbi:MAG: cysteine desulfurase [Candidatus Latescibacteria bacterium]|nr:cysteine desulfurase [Candidatus Latescibacterota bacterium]
MHKIYLDNNSTTQVDPEVVQAMLPYFSEYYGNPSNLHSFGRDAKEVLELAREQVARLINARPEEIIFTSSGTESDNLAVVGTYKANMNRGSNLIISAFEHSAVYYAANYLKKWHNADIVKLPLDQHGIASPLELSKAITDKTVLVSVMYVNNEIGTIEPIQRLAHIAHQVGAYFHTDAVAAAGKIPIDVKALEVDLLTISSHKIHGPKGVGALYVKPDVDIQSVLYGGLQEHGLRPGTENLAGIVGFGKAAEIAKRDLSTGVPEKIKVLRDYLQEEFEKKIPDIKINGHPFERVCNILNISVAYVEGEALLMNLDLEGIAVSSGSACSTGKADVSHVLKAIGVEDKYINSPVRMSLDKNNTKEEIDYTIDTMVKIVERLRTISPLWKPKK